MIRLRRPSYAAVGRTLLLLPLLVLLGGCGEADVEQNRPAEATSAQALRRLQPTPTLKAGLATATQPPAVASSPTAAASPTPTVPPTATPSPEERVSLGQSLLGQQNFEEAARQFQAGLSAPGALDRAQQETALHGLGLAYLRDGRYTEAVDAFQRYLDLSRDSGSEPGAAAPEAANEEQSSATFHLGQAYRGLGDCQAAIDAYRTYLAANEELAAYVQPLIAGCYKALGETASATAAYEAAAAAPAHRLREVETRQKLANIYLNAEEYEAAIAQYDAIHNLAETENTRGQMTYLAGTAQLLAGNQQAAYQRFRRAVDRYPRAHGSYLGLVELVDAGVEVDSFQRGLVDFHADAFEPAVAAFEAYLQANPSDYRADTHLYLAWSYEGLGNLEAALSQMEAYAAYGAGEEAPHAAEAGLERAEMLARNGRPGEAIEAYLDVVATYTTSDEARAAAWRAARLAERQDDTQRAGELYARLAQQYPDHDEAPRALFRAGLLAWRGGQEETAVEAWRRLAEDYGQSEFGAAGLLWLMRVLPEEEAGPYVITATSLSGVGYYPLRAAEVANGREPFASPQELDLEADEAAEQAQTEAWLAQWLDVEDGTVSGELSLALAQDGRLVRGQKLWSLGLHSEAKAELEALRRAHVDDALATYQLALFFRELGLYRSSILAAETLIRLSGETVFEVPRLVGRLSYPVYYNGLILSLAEEYGYDPLLQFALVRQESLFESFITSFAGAQGLSQVMPATGQDIAKRLGWADFANEDLYRPFVGLAFGAYYLQEQLATFDGDVYAALAAYNGGPGNAARWRAAAPDDPDRFLETVDYPETRRYIKHIFTGHAIYRHLYESN